MWVVSVRGVVWCDDDDDDEEEFVVFWGSCLCVIYCKVVF